jgi:hypothetical protein
MGLVFSESAMARRVVKGGGIETQLYPPRPIVEECVFAGLGKCGSGGWWLLVVVVCEFGKSKSRMSDLKKCRLGNLSNKGKLLCERVLSDEDPIQRPEGAMDYIQDPFFRDSPGFPTVASSTARHEWSRVASQELWRKRLCLR